jgi:hypothetical protein
LSKEKFMELLSKKDKKSEADKAKVSDSDKPKWGVLSDNYMLGASFKKWKDNEEEEEDEESQSEEEELEEESENEMELESE